MTFVFTVSLFRYGQRRYGPQVCDRPICGMTTSYAGTSLPFSSILPTCRCLQTSHGIYNQARCCPRHIWRQSDGSSRWHGPARIGLCCLLSNGFYRTPSLNLNSCDELFMFSDGRANLKKRHLLDFIRHFRGRFDISQHEAAVLSSRNLPRK